MPKKFFSINSSELSSDQKFIYNNSSNFRIKVIKMINTIHEKIKEQDMFGQPVGLNYSEEEDEYTSTCSGFLSFCVKVFFMVLLYSKIMIIKDKS